MSLQKSIPIEIIGRILSFVLASPADDPQKLPAPRPHPVSVLLVCKGITRLLLPYFYRSIQVLKPMDWYTLFNPEFGVLALDEKDTPEDERRFPPLTVRQRWVHELFLGLTANGAPVEYPVDATAAKDAAVDWDRRTGPDGYVEDEDDDELPVLGTLPPWLLNLCRIPCCQPNLSNLVTLISTPLVRPNPESELDVVLQNYKLQLRAYESGVYGENLPDDVWVDYETAVGFIAKSHQAGWLQKLGIVSRLTTVHLPADYTLLENHRHSAFNTIYRKAANAELVAYLNLGGLHHFDDPEPLYSNPPLSVFFELLDELDQDGCFKDKHGKGTPLNKNILLVGPAYEMVHVIDPELADEAEDTKGWEWLAPDGKKRHPLAALWWDEEGWEDDEEEGYPSEGKYIDGEYKDSGASMSEEEEEEEEDAEE